MKKIRISPETLMVFVEFEGVKKSLLSVILSASEGSRHLFSINAGMLHFFQHDIFRYFPVKRESRTSELPLRDVVSTGVTLTLVAGFIAILSRHLRHRTRFSHAQPNPRVP